TARPRCTSLPCADSGRASSERRRHLLLVNWLLGAFLQPRHTCPARIETDRKSRHCPHASRRCFSYPLCFSDITYLTVRQPSQISSHTKLPSLANLSRQFCSPSRGWLGRLLPESSPRLPPAV